MTPHDISKETTLYDIYMIRACNRIPPLPEGYELVPEQVMGQMPRTLYVGLPLVDARQYLKALKDAGGAARLAPIQYRRPGITVEQGMERGREEFEKRRTPGQAYDPIVFLRNEGVWRLYCVPRREPFVDNRIPGHMYLLIDKLDGHLYSLEEEGKWASLSDV